MKVVKSFSRASEYRRGRYLPESIVVSADSRLFNRPKALPGATDVSFT